LLWDFFIVPIFTAMKFEFSFIIPVYNRPQEIKELLESFVNVRGIDTCEIVIVEDGSDLLCKDIVSLFKNKLAISYYFKKNSGPGDSRNYGMKHAQADYFIILDSDVLLPSDYIINLKKHLKTQFTHCFGGPDKANQSFSPVQKAINYVMTSLWTTGGIRGREAQKKKFQPRSFNMGLSKQAFQKSKGFSNIHPGEDPDLSIRLQQLGFKTALFSDCFVYHKRRIDWKNYAKQMYKFGLVRPILNTWHPSSHKILYYFPTLFSLGFLMAIVLLFFDYYFFVLLYLLYFSIIFIDAFIQNKNLKIAFYAIYATCIQFVSYGWGYLNSTLSIFVFKKPPENTYPKLFFKPKT
jgi:glycosyltransferase involved in cell wall biosynthesis